MQNRISGLSYNSWRILNLAVITIFIALLVVRLNAVNQIVSQIVLNVTHSPFHKITATIQDLSSVNKQNRLLRDSLAVARLQIDALEEARRENIRLRSVLGFEPPPGYRLLPARVVSVTGGQLPISATINRGFYDSVVINQPVINQVGLVGRIQEVMPGYATVQCLTDPLNRVAVRVATSREMGIVRFLPNEGMILSDFPNQGAIEIADTILSSGLGQVYPPGLKVGVVTAVERPENTPYANIHLKPIVNFRSIEELFILIPEEQ